MSTKYRDFCITINNYNPEWIQQIINKYKVKYIIIGEEIAPTTQTPHLQIYIYFQTQKQLTGVIKLFKEYNNAHVEIRHKNSTPKQAAEYCKKEGKYHEYGTLPEQGKGINSTWEEIDKQIKEGTTITELHKQYPEIAIKYGKGLKEHYNLLKPTITYNIYEDLKDKNTVLYDYQHRLLEYVKETPSERSILWFYDELGNSGKTSLADHLTDNEKFITLSNGKTADIAYTWNGENVIFDYSRSQQNHINYEVLENLKNGRILSTKYESIVKKYKRPHIIVFANFKPQVNKLSLDRWAIYEINNDKIMIDITEQTIEEQQYDI